MIQNKKSKTNLVSAAKRSPEGLSKVGDLKKSSGGKKRKFLLLVKITAVIIAVLVVVLGVLGVLSYKPAKAAYESAMEGKSKIQEAQAAIEAQDFDRAASLIIAAKEDFRKADQNFQKIKWVKAIPFARHQYLAVEHLLKGGTQIIYALETGVSVADKLMGSVEAATKTGSFSELSTEQKGEILKQLRENSPELERALSQIELAEIELGQIPEKGVITQIKEAKNLIYSKLPQGKKILKEVVFASKLLPGLAGYPNEQKYLILFENNTELRPSGGFIGSYGVVGVKSAEIQAFTTHDVYNLDKNANINVEAPWQIKKLVNPYLQTWNFRDSNWSPDFPESARKAEWFYEIEGGEGGPFDGVIAITPDLIKYMLEITGPTKVAGYPYTFTSENLTEQLEYHVEMNYVSKGIDFHERKDIISDLSQTLLGKIFKLPKEEWVKIFEVMQRAFLEKQIVMYVNNQDVQKFLKEKNWDGAIKENSGDYIMVVDANMASLKTDEFIERSFIYEADFRDEKPAVKMSLTYKNSAPGITWKTTRYRNWNRILVPKGSEIDRVDGNEEGSIYYNDPTKDYEVTEEVSKTGLGSFISIEPRGERTMTYYYTIPKTVIRDDGYHLYFQKQIGVSKPKIKVKLIFPKKISSFSPAEYGKILSENEIEYNLDLQTDREFHVTFK